MSSLEKKRIINFVKDYYYKKILNEEFNNKSIRLNNLITLYFKKNLSHLCSDNVKENRKLFYSYRNKYMSTFKYGRQKVIGTLFHFRKTKVAKQFKNSFSYEEWIIMDGDDLLKKLSLDDDFSSNKKDYERLKMIVEHVTKNYKLYKR